MDNYLTKLLELYDLNTRDIYDLLNQDNTTLSKSMIDKWFVDHNLPTYRPMSGHWYDLIIYRLNDPRNKPIKRAKKKPV